MKNCLVPAELLDEDVCSLPLRTVHHLRTVLRIKTGEELRLLDGRGRSRAVKIISANKTEIICEAAGNIEFVPPPFCRLRLFVGIAKPARMDWLVEKAVELGASVLTPVLTERCVARYRAGETVGRWERIAANAVEQCGTAWLTEIEPVHSWSEAVREMSSSRPVFAALLAADARPVAEALSGWPDRTPACAAWVVGPEGDFTSAEQQDILNAGAIPVSLGSNVLRTETAAIYGLCSLALNFRGNPQEGFS